MLRRPQRVRQRRQACDQLGHTSVTMTEAYIREQQKPCPRGPTPIQLDLSGPNRVIECGYLLAYMRHAPLYVLRPQATYFTRPHCGFQGK